MTKDVRQRLRRVASRQNALVKELRRAFARSETTADGACAIESVRLVEEAIRSGLKLRAVFFRQSSLAVADRLLPQIAAQVETVLLPNEIFDSAVATETPQGVAALVRLAAGAEFPGWTIAVGPLIGALLWPVITTLLLMPQRRPVEVDETRAI